MPPQAVYKFRVIFEEYDYISRDIEIRAVQTFDDLARAINSSIGYDHANGASLFISDEHWKKGQEFSSKIEKKERGLYPMKNSRLTDHINDPHQKLYYIIYSEPVWEFFVELIKILKDDSGGSYPRCVREAGAAPKQSGVTVLVSEAGDLDLPDELSLPEGENIGGESEESPELETVGETEPTSDDLEINPGEFGQEEEPQGDTESE